MPRKVTAYFALVAMLLEGCTSAPRSHDVQVAQWPGDKGPPAQVLPEGTYALYHQTSSPEAISPTSGDTSRQAAKLCGLHGLFHLSGTGPVGFEKADDGQLFAVVGEEKFPLPPGCYCWRTVNESKAPEIQLSTRQNVVLALHQVGQAAGQVLLLVTVAALGAGLFVVIMMAAGHQA